MAERRVKVPEAVDPLADLNDHLGRFLRQADELLDDWSRFGAGVRARLDEQLRDVEAAFARGADAAAAKAAAAMARGLDETAAARIDRALGERVASLRAELERLERIARGLGGAAAPAKSDPRIDRIWIAVIATNALLVVVIALVWLRGAPPPAANTPMIAPPAVVDAAPPQPPDASMPDASPPDAQLPPDASPAPVPRGHHAPAHP